jgi:hypothetical protein
LLSIQDHTKKFKGYIKYPTLVAGAKAMAINSIHPAKRQISDTVLGL